MLTTITRRLAVLVTVAGLAVGLSACSSSGSKGASGSTGTGDAISILNQKFTVGSAKAGDTITVTNNDSVTHTVTSDDGSSFSVSINGGKTATFTAPAAGSYKFHCKIHSNMHGTLTVT
jgi:plastocyanin